VVFGSWVEARLAETDKKGRRKYTLAGLLRPAREKGQEERPARTTRFRALRGRALRKVRIGPDGIW